MNHPSEPGHTEAAGEPPRIEGPWEAVNPTGSGPRPFPRRPTHWPRRRRRTPRAATTAPQSKEHRDA